MKRLLLPVLFVLCSFFLHTNAAPFNSTNVVIPGELTVQSNRFLMGTNVLTVTGGMLYANGNKIFDSSKWAWMKTDGTKYTVATTGSVFAVRNHDSTGYAYFGMFVTAGGYVASYGKDSTSVDSGCVVLNSHDKDIVFRTGGVTRQKLMASGTWNAWSNAIDNAKLGNVRQIQIRDSSVYTDWPYDSLTIHAMNPVTDTIYISDHLPEGADVKAIRSQTATGSVQFLVATQLWSSAFSSYGTVRHGFTASAVASNAPQSFTVSENSRFVIVPTNITSATNWYVWVDYAMP